MEKCIANFFKNLYHILALFYLLLKYKGWRFIHCPQFNGDIAILANGPSLKNEFDNILQRNNHFAHSKLMMMNWSILEPLFFQTRPDFFVIADPAFWFPGNTIIDKIKVFNDKLAQVDWELIVIAPARMAKENHWEENPHLHFTYFNTNDFDGSPAIRHWVYKHGLSSPVVYNVTSLAIYSSLQMGFKHIRLYGLDHSFFSGLMVNQENILCKCDSHFYNAAKIAPFYKPDKTSETFKMAEYIKRMWYTFHAHELLQDYSKSCKKGEIINCTKSSLVDCYTREETQKEI